MATVHRTVSPHADDIPLESRLAQRMRRVAGSAIMDLLKTAVGRDLIPFASGLPDPDLFPTAALAEVAEEVLTADGRTALQYGPAEGHPPLRARVAEMLRGRGLTDATAEHILITNGSEQALDLAARAFLDRGDTVLLETPSYLAAIQTFDSYEAAYCAVPMDEEGMDVDTAAARIGPGQPRLLYTLPNFQNPTGITLSLARRQRLAELAAQHQMPVVEDDAYHDLSYDGAPLLPLAALAKNPLAVYTGTFSKTITPGVRVGYLYAQPPLAARLGHLKQIADLGTGAFTQRMVLRYCERGLLEPHIATLCAAYRARRDTVLEALDGSLRGVAQWTCPGGGMFLLLSLPDDLDTAALLPLCMDRGVVYVPGASFHPVGGGRHTLRLNFVSAREDAIRRGVAILRDVFTEACQSR